MAHIEFDFPQAKSVNKNFLNYIEHNLQVAGIHDARVRFLLDRNGEPVSWTGRPFVVETPDQLFLYKTYQKDAKLEQEVLNQVQGIVAPRIRYFGADFFIEEYLDPFTYNTLEHYADSGLLEFTLEMSSYAHALLTKLGVCMGDRHYYDELFVSSHGQPQFVDFGYGFFLHSPSAHVPRLLLEWNNDGIIQKVLHSAGQNSFLVAHSSKTVSDPHILQLCFGVGGVAEYMYGRYGNQPDQDIVQIYVNSYTTAFTSN